MQRMGRGRGKTGHDHVVEEGANCVFVGFVVGA